MFCKMSKGRTRKYQPETIIVLPALLRQLGAIFGPARRTVTRDWGWPPTFCLVCQKLPRKNKERVLTGWPAGAPIECDLPSRWSCLRLTRAARVKRLASNSAMWGRAVDAVDAVLWGRAVDTTSRIQYGREIAAHGGCWVASDTVQYPSTFLLGNPRARIQKSAAETLRNPAAGDSHSWHAQLQPR